jgi:phosphatidate cytidylyltransferase
MLRQRIITALVLLGLLVPAVFSSNPLPFVFLTALLIGAAAWEWARLNAMKSRSSLATAVMCAGLCGALWFSGAASGAMAWVWISAGAAWVGLALWLLPGGIGVWLLQPLWLRWLGGMVLLCAAWLALVQAWLVGIDFLFSLMLLVWVADVAAYFSGRALGGRFFHQKLASSISPGKTWEGVAGAMVGVLCMAFAWRALDLAGVTPGGSIYSRLGSVSLVFLTVSLVFLTTMGVVGDLMESLFKRAADVKDSGVLLPGHGGVLDRIDALLPVLPLAMLLCTL